MIQRMSRIYFIPVLLIISAIVFSKPAESAQDKITGDTLIVSDIERFAVINPLLTITTFSARLIEIIFDGLVVLDDRFEVKPRLAQSWDRSQDGRTWTFHLRPGVRFHDGVELTADDVAFTFEKMMELSGRTPFGSNFEEVASVRVMDKFTVQIILKEAVVSFLQSLVVPILPKHLLEGQDIEKTSFNVHPVGTGPYKLKSWSDKEIVLEANGSYFLGRSNLDQIRVVAYPNREAAWAKLMAGEVDFFDFLAPDNYETLKRVPGFNFYSVPMPFYYLVAFNLKEPRFKDRRVRQALNYAINKEEIVAKVLKGQGRTAAGTIYPGSWAFDSNVAPYPYNPKKALTLLSAAGWKDHDGDHFLDKGGKPFYFTIHVNSGDDIKQKTLLVIQQQLLDIGIRVKVVLFDATDPDFLFRKQFDAHFPELLAKGDPDINYKFWHSSQIDGGFNVSSYRNGAVDRLLDEGRTEFDSEKRKAVYSKFQKEMHDNPPGVFLFWTNYLVGVQKRFKGVTVSPEGPFANIREWYVPKAEQRYIKSE